MFLFVFFFSWQVPARLDGTSLFLLLGVQPVDKPVESGSTGLSGARRGSGRDWVFRRKQLCVRTGSLQGLQSKVSCGKEYCYDNRMTMQYAVPDRSGISLMHMDTHTHAHAYACVHLSGPAIQCVLYAVSTPFTTRFDCGICVAIISAILFLSGCYWVENKRGGDILTCEM